MTQDSAHDRRDLAPGEETGGGDHSSSGLRSYTFGLFLAVGLTAASFLASDAQGPIWGPAVPIALAVLAIAQMGIHLVFFLHITTGPDNTNNVMALAFGVLIVFLIVFGSLWIMANLNHNMMPVAEMIRMQH